MADVDWAGVRFVPIYHHDGRFFRGPGLFAFVRRGEDEDRTLLFVGHSESIASAVSGHRLWAEALGLGFNELNINLKATEKVDRLVLQAHIIKRCEPILNVLNDEAASVRRPDPMSLWRDQRRA